MPSDNKVPKPINYSNRDFTSIKNDLVEYAKRYYPDTYKDFNAASFGSLMLDTVAYVGDMLSFYLDYQANESFLATSNEYLNILKHGRQMGYKYDYQPSSHGILNFFVLIPADAKGTAPDSDYYPVILRGSKFKAQSGNAFTLTEDVHFSKSNNEIVVAQVDDATGNPITYAVKANGKVVSGKYFQETVAIGNYQRFLKIPLVSNTIAEIISIIDSEGHEYFQVDHLSQNTVYINVENRSSDRNLAPSILKAIAVPRRYSVETNQNITYLQFGYGSESELKTTPLYQPENVVLKQHAKDYITQATFDPAVLNESDKFGVVPANTTLTVIYRANERSNVNAAANTVTEPSTVTFVFPSTGATDANKQNTVRGSLECTNLDPIVGDITIPTPFELKQRIAHNFATQNRAVTKKDYMSLVYRMPPQFGAIRKCNILQDSDSFKRNLNVYVISEGEDGFLIKPNNTIKQNLKTWLNQYRMINDTVDILDAKIVNLGIDFVAVGRSNQNKVALFNQILTRLKNFINFSPEIGEPFYITDVYKIINTTPGVIDTTDVTIINKTGGAYSDIAYNVEQYMSPDGRLVEAPENVIFEIKYPNLDIKGTIK